MRLTNNCRVVERLPTNQGSGFQLSQTALERAVIEGTLQCDLPAEIGNCCNIPVNRSYPRNHLRRDPRDLSRLPPFYSVPVPLSATVCGLPPPLSLT